MGRLPSARPTGGADASRMAPTADASISSSIWVPCLTGGSRAFATGGFTATAGICHSIPRTTTYHVGIPPARHRRAARRRCPSDECGERRHRCRLPEHGPHDVHRARAPPRPRVKPQRRKRHLTTGEVTMRRPATWWMQAQATTIGDSATPADPLGRRRMGLISHDDQRPIALGTQPCSPRPRVPLHCSRYSGGAECHGDDLRRMRLPGETGNDRCQVRSPSRLLLPRSVRSPRLVGGKTARLEDWTEPGSASEHHQASSSQPSCVSGSIWRVAWSMPCSSWSSSRA